MHQLLQFWGHLGVFFSRTYAGARTREDEVHWFSGLVVGLRVARSRCARPLTGYTGQRCA